MVVTNVGLNGLVVACCTTQPGSREFESHLWTRSSGCQASPESVFKMLLVSKDLALLPIVLAICETAN